MRIIPLLISFQPFSATFILHVNDPFMIFISHLLLFNFYLEFFYLRSTQHRTEHERKRDEPLKA